MHKTITERTLKFISGIDANSVRELLDKLQVLVDKDNDSWISMWISSSGGSTSAGKAFFDATRYLLKPKLQTVGIGCVDSMGVVLYLAGSYRVITSNTNIFLHEVARTVKGETRFPISEMRGALINADHDQEIYINILAKNTKLKRKDILKMMIGNTTITAKDALKYGFAHEII